MSDQGDSYDRPDPLWQEWHIYGRHHPAFRSPYVIGHQWSVYKRTDYWPNGVAVFKYAKPVWMIFHISLHL